MGRRFRVPLAAIVGALAVLLALLATLQYRWLGRISSDERDRMRATLQSRASAFGQDVDRELTRAYLLFQFDPVESGDNLSARIGVLVDRWQATARFPRLVKDTYVIRDGGLQRYDSGSRFLVPATWPQALADVQRQFAQRPVPERQDVLRRTIGGAIGGDAIVVPLIMLEKGQGSPLRISTADVLLQLDMEYLETEMLPALARQYFRGTGDGFDYELAVVRTTGGAPLYRSQPGFSPAPNARADAAVDLFQIRPQDFTEVAAETRRFTALVGSTGGSVREAAGAHSSGSTAAFSIHPDRSIAIVVEQGKVARPDALAAGVKAATAARAVMAARPAWRLLVKHPSGSLEAAVDAQRRRNLLVSSSVLAVLAVSMGLLVASARREHALARQQLEFVAAVSHELRTPLAVIRSAADNLADGVVHDPAQVRRYGDLVRGEGRRLTEMVEQILELSGIQSGQRGLALRSVAVEPLVRDVLRSCAAFIDEARVSVDVDIPANLPPVLGDESALRRVVQNLVGNAVKYGGSARWVGITAASEVREIALSVADRGIGISAAEQEHIFDPFYRAPAVIEAQIQGAGLGLSLVRRIVDAHGGRIAVRSAPGEGSTFTVRLPAATAEPIARTAHGGAPDPSPSHP